MRKATPRAALLVASLVACGAAKRSASPPMAAETSPADAPTTMPGGVDAKSEIDRLSAEVDTQRTELGLAEPSPMSSGAPPASPMSVIPLSTDESCKPAKTERCQGSCKISDSICKNASRICELAKDLAADGGWAATKCARANQTCEAAHDTCCSCQ